MPAIEVKDYTINVGNAKSIYDTTVHPGDMDAVDAIRAIPSGLYSNTNATATIKATAGVLIGFYVCSTSSGTLVLRDGGAGGTAISGTITPAIGWHSFPVHFATDLHITIANTLVVTFIYK